MNSSKRAEYSTESPRPVRLIGDKPSWNVREIPTGTSAKLKSDRLESIISGAVNISQVIRNIDTGKAGRIEMELYVWRSRGAGTLESYDGVGNMKLADTASGKCIRIRLISIYIDDDTFGYDGLGVHSRASSKAVSTVPNNSWYT